MYEEDPTLSLRKAAAASGVSATTVRSILLNDLHLKPYKYQEYQMLNEGDPEKRLNFARWVVSLPEGALLMFICSDEAYFYLCESINKQNNRQWLESKPTDKIERPLHDEKVLLWCAISASKIYGPFYFESSVNRENYLEMLNIFSDLNIGVFLIIKIIIFSKMGHSSYC